jgi:hypothetical protein
LGKYKVEKVPTLKTEKGILEYQKIGDIWKAFQ